MRPPRITTHGLLLIVASAGVTLAMYVAIQRDQWGAVVFLTVAACMATLAVAAASREFDHRRAGTGRGGSGLWWRVPIKSLSVSVVLIGLPDLAFVAAYWCSCGGGWYVIPVLHGPRELNVTGAQVAAVVALVVAALLRRALWTGSLRRSSRLYSFGLAVSIVALLLACAWLSQRRASYQELARDHEVSEGHYGGAEWAVHDPESPPDEAKAIYHGRMRRRFERAARYPWLTVEPDRPPP